MYSIWSVSYTHLDVYKRQTFNYCTLVPYYSKRDHAFFDDEPSEIDIFRKKEKI